MPGKITRKNLRRRAPRAAAPDDVLKDTTSGQRKRLRGRSPSPLDPSEGTGASRCKRRSKKQKQQKEKNKKNSSAKISTLMEIPESLKHDIVKTDQGHFEMTFPIDTLDGLRRLAWGLDLRARSVVVYLKFPPKNDRNADHALFCVHASTDVDELQGPGDHQHQFSSTASTAAHAVGEPCTPRACVLTIVLHRELYGLLGKRGCRALDVLHARVAEVLTSDPTRACLVCGRAFGARIYTPTACLGACMAKLEGWPLRARLSHLLSDVKSLDFLLCSIYTAVDGQEKYPDTYKTESSLLVDCPLKLENIQPAIDSFPKISAKLSMSDLLKEGCFRIERRRLLSWLALRFRGCMVSLAPAARHLVRGEGLKGCHQFMVLNARLERQEKFVQEIKKIGVGSVAFHGCRAARVFNILTDALRVPSKLPYFKIDSGISLSNDPDYSTEYAQGDKPFRAWKNSQFWGTPGTSWATMFGIEVAKPCVAFKHSESSINDESLVMVRYVFLVPTSDRLGRSYSPPKLKIDQIAMKKAFKTLDEDTLSPRHIGRNVGPTEKSAAKLTKLQDVKCRPA